jgi:hypothetical protein
MNKLNKMFNVLLEKLKMKSKFTPQIFIPKMYLILREDLAFKYIQGAHALAQFAIENPLQFSRWDNSYLICLSVFNGQSLQKICLELNKNHIRYSKFIEPDLNSDLPTSICLFDEYGDKQKYLKELSLATK